MPSETVILDLDSSQYEAALKRVAEISERYDAVQKEVAKGNTEIERAFKRTLTAADRSALQLVKLDKATADANKSTAAYKETQDKLLKTVHSQIEGSKRFTKAMEVMGQGHADVTQAVLLSVAAHTKAAQKQAESAESAEDLTMVIRKLAFETNDAEKATDEYKGTLAALQKRLAGVKLEEDEHRARVMKLSDAYAANTQRLDAVETAMDSLSVPGAALITRLKGLSDSLDTIHEHGSRAEATLLKGAIAVGAVGAAATAAVVGVAAIGSAVVATTAAAADWNEELRAIGLAVEQAPLERYSASIDAVWASFKAVGVAVATVFGPAVEVVATRVVALTLAAIDMFNTMVKGEGIVHSLTVAFAQTLTDGIALPVKALLSLQAGLVDLLSILPGNEAAIQKMQTAIDEAAGGMDAWRSEQIPAVTAALKGMARDGLEPLIAASDDYMARAAELIGKITAVNAAVREGTVAMREHATVAMPEVTAAWGEFNSQMSGPTSAQIDASMKEFGELADAGDAAAAKAKASWTGTFAQIGGAASQLSALMIEQSQEQGDAAHKAAVAMFRVNQAAGLANVAISTAQAVMVAMTLPPPVSYVAAAAAVIAGAAQAAVILSQSPPSPSGGASATMPSAPSSPGIGSGRPSSAMTTTGSSASTDTGTTTTTIGGAAVSTQPETNVNIERAQGNAVAVTDASFGPSSSAQFIRTTPGDVADIERGGSRRRRDAAMIAEMQAARAATERQTTVLERLELLLVMRQHTDATTQPSRQYLG